MCSYLEKLNDNNEYLDIHELLNRLGGNVILVNKFIGIFYKTFKDVATELEDKIKANQYEEAMVLVHKLKVSSNNLSLTSIYDKSCQLEQGLKLGQETVIDHEFKVLKEALDGWFKIIE